VELLGLVVQSPIKKEDEDFCILFGLLFSVLKNLKIHKTKALKNI